MDFGKLLDPIADYFNFVVDFLMFRGLSPFVRLGSVSPKLISFLFLGILFAFVVKRARGIPSFGDEVRFSNSPSRQNIPSSPADQKSDISRMFESSELLLLVLFQISGTLLFHLSLIIASKFMHIDSGNFKDSLNATIAVSSIQYPLQAILHRLYTFIRRIEKFNKRTRAIALAVYLTYLIIVAFQLFYFFHAAAVIHNVPIGRLILPGLITVAFILVLILSISYFAKIWRKMYVDPFH